MPVQRVDDYRVYRAEIVQKDYDEFRANRGDIRAAFHCAISLYHLADWVYVAHNTQINATFQFRANGGLCRVTDEKTFPNALADAHPDFELIRSVANAAKHLKLGTKPTTRPIPPLAMPPIPRRKPAATAKTSETTSAAGPVSFLKETGVR